MASRLSLTVLVDNNTLTDRYFAGEPGLSFLLETAQKKILFDTGYRMHSLPMQGGWERIFWTWITSSCPTVTSIIREGSSLLSGT